MSTWADCTSSKRGNRQYKLAASIAGLCVQSFCTAVQSHKKGHLWGAVLLSRASKKLLQNEESKLVEKGPKEARRATAELRSVHGEGCARKEQFCWTCWRVRDGGPNV
eukprot:1155146-Pelagomonas_calceolata.AAC.2